MSRVLLQTEFEIWSAERERIARRKGGWLAALLRRFSPSDHMERSR
ncbi:hypothetical protein [Phenylobacterium sp.]